MAYMIAAGHDVALESLTALVPQPASIGYQFGRRSYAASGAIYDELPHVELNYTTLGYTSTRYQSLLTQTGLLVAKTALVTVYIQDENYDWILRNGTIVKPQIGVDGERADYGYKNFTFLVHSLRATA